ncbi:hypothetical protein QJQ45_018301 [Haematococcus lacustris]|nr:hypothetical protein QJQ45_018301 [Haematococcus lacustris]
MQKHASLGRCQRSGQMQIVSRRVSQGLLALAHSAPTPFTSRLLACQTAHPSAWRLPAHAPSTDAPSQDFAGFPITHYDVRFQNMMMASGQLEYGLRVQNGPNGRIGTGVLYVYNSGKEPDRFYIELARPAMIDRALSLARPKCLVHVQGALRRDDVQTASGETETRFVIEADMASASIVVVSDSGPRRDGISAGLGQSSNPSQPHAQLNNMAMPGSFAASAPVAAARVPGPTSPAHTSFAGGPTPPDANSRLETLGIEQQWAHVAAYPHMWWDNRKNKLNPRGPDFKLRDKSHNVALWVDRPRGKDQLRGRVVLVDDHRTTRVSSAVNGQHPLAPRKPPQAPCSSQAATQPAASEPGPSTPPPVERSKRTKAEQEAEPTQPTKGIGKGKGKAARAKPAPQPGRWLDRDCNAALNMQRIGKSRWRPLELCYWWLDRDTNPCLNFQRIGESKQRPLELCRWDDLEALPPIGKEYHQRFKLVNDRLPKARQRLHRAAEYRRGIDGRARNNA